MFKQTSELTAPFSLIKFLSIPKTLLLTRSEYEIIEPRKKSELPGVSVIILLINPPVIDSAALIVILRPFLSIISFKLSPIDKLPAP